jgi:hypothetical protein
MNSRQRRKLEAARHNAEHELRMEWERVRPLFLYLFRLCRTEEQDRRSQKARKIMREVMWQYRDYTPTIHFR